MEKEITVNVSITRDSRDAIRISFQDEASNIRFVSVSMTPHDFAMAVTGLSHVEAKATVCGLRNVGLKKISQKRQAECPLTNSDRKELTQWLLDNCQEDGWTINGYLGSQGSVGHYDGGSRTLNYSVYRYADEESSEA